MKRLMLAPNELIDDIIAKYPLDCDVYASPKIDGNRIALHQGTTITRSFKKAPNLFLQKRYKDPIFQGLDGEVTVGPAWASDVFLKTYVTRRIHEVPTADPWVMHIFDLFDQPTLTFDQRYEVLQERFATVYRDIEHLRLIPQNLMSPDQAFDWYEEKMLDVGYEGIMLRKPLTLYREGRCTPKQGYILKVKRFEYDEAEIIGFEEAMTNTNVAYINENGYQKRSTHKDGMIPMGTLGSLICREVKPFMGKRQVFNVGSGFTDALKDEIWNNQDKWLGDAIRFKHFPKGRKDLPRFPVYAGSPDSAPIDID